ncbi:uncharacterized protein METZ01_LOCUS168225 [marine metagenome]|uniref:NADH dehydrogenase [ubiquinone] 1 alpha subcomplex assembly factor 3 n=1 Tax=marine metagenome TaxID=408172 RepID=A0A382BPB4_9ZZZZ
MQFTKEPILDLTIKEIDAKSIKIGDKQINHSIVLSPTKIIGKWSRNNVKKLTLDDFKNIITITPDIILLGTGKNLIFPPRELIFQMAKLDIGLEVMSTQAACRTFNLLISEYREPIAILMFD